MAAALHPDIRGRYPHFNISARLVRPDESRLAPIAEAGKHASTYSHRHGDAYATEETLSAHEKLRLTRLATET